MWKNPHRPQRYERRDPYKYIPFNEPVEVTTGCCIIIYGAVSAIILFMLALL
jgi:hypothetical protein